MCGAGCNQSDVMRAEESFIEIGAQMFPLQRCAQIRYTGAAEAGQAGLAASPCDKKGCSFGEE